MRLKPKSLFRSRVRTSPVTPRYMPLVLDLARRQAGDIRPGHCYEVQVRHDGDCAHWTGGPCECNPEATLLELAPAAG
jgi:hypothetical protein